MKFTRERSEGLYTVHAYQQGEVTLNSPRAEDNRDEDGRVVVKKSFIVSPARLVRDWPPTAMNRLCSADLTPLTEMSPEVILLGSGAMMAFPEREQLEALVALGIGYEVMDSAAACRTYNILAGEGRQVAAAIIVE